MRALAAAILALSLNPAEQPLQTAVTSPVLEGNTIRVSVSGAGLDGAVAVFGGKTVQLFAQGNGTYLGLMPAGVTEPPGTHTLAIRDAAAKTLAEVPVLVRDARFPKQNIEVTPGMKQLHPVPADPELRRAFRHTVTVKRYWAEPFRAPTQGCMNSIFGVLRYHNGEYTGEYHRGVDVRAPAGRPVRAVAAGVVRVARRLEYTGGTVGLDHGQGLSSLYMHLSRVLVKEGQTVRKGEVIGRVGATGFATGPHLHWALYANGVPVNPAQWAPNPRCGQSPRRRP